PPGAPDAGDENNPLGRDPELGHELLDRREHGVVAAARAPAGLLVGLEVRLGQLGRRTVPVAVDLDRGHRPSSLSIAACASFGFIAAPRSAARSQRRTAAGPEPCRTTRRRPGTWPAAPAPADRCSSRVRAP